MSGILIEGPGAVSPAPVMVNTWIGGVDMAQRTCSVDGCERLVYRRGWCSGHYHRWYETGDLRPHVPLKVTGQSCAVGDCRLPSVGRQMCRTHYTRWHSTGDPRPGVPIVPIGRTDAERFWAKVDRRGADECWEWRGSQNGTGYGHFHPAEKRDEYAHRFAYASEVGPIGSGMEVDHLCRNRLCVNPAHLDQVTRTENIRRGLAARGGRRSVK